MTAAFDTIERRIEENQSLVRALATKIRSKAARHLELDDLIAYGQIGLAEAARDFDPSRGAEFSTYAYYRIRGSIYDGLSKMSWRSRAQYKRLRVEQMAGEVLAETNSAGGHGPEGDLQWLAQTTQQLVIIYLTAGSARDGGLEQVPDPGDTPEMLATNREIHKKLRALIEDLPRQLGVLIRSVYFEGMTLQEAANVLGLSKSWASRLHVKALQKLEISLRNASAGD